MPRACAPDEWIFDPAVAAAQTRLVIVEGRGPLPAGVVTFVVFNFGRSPASSVRHNPRTSNAGFDNRAALGHAISEAGGALVEADDALALCAFSDPLAAIHAAAWIGHSDSPPVWSHDVGRGVSIGIHAGLAYPRGDRYVSLAAHRARRVAEAANPGQTVVSGEVALLLGNDLALDLRTRGRYRVPDFADPVELYEVENPQRGPMPPLRVPPAQAHNILPPRTSLVGRAAALDDLAQRLSSYRLVTVVGPGGVGKTRLVSEYGLRNSGAWFDGIWVAHLSALHSGTLIDQAVAAALGVATSEDREPTDQVLDHLGDREAVIVLDNCEHLRVEAARFVHTVLHRCPSVRVVATSRQPLGLIDESILRLRPLGEAEAVELFLARAGRYNASWSGRNADIEALCRRLDGLPLAVEIAAAQASVLSPSVIVDQLDRHVLPSAIDPTLEPRQQALSHLVDWSYGLLTDDEQHAFQCLSIFADHFELEDGCAAIAAHPAASRTPDEPGSADSAELIWSLASKSLLEMQDAGNATTYRMLSTLRAFARTRTVEDEHLRVARRVAERYLHSLGPEADRVDLDVIHRRGRELANLRHLASLLGDAAPDLADGLMWTAAAHLRLTSKAATAREIHEHLERFPHTGIERFGLLIEAGRCASDRGQLDLAETYLHLAVPLGVRHRIPPWFDMQLDMLAGMLYVQRGAPNLAHKLALDALPNARTAAGRALMMQLAGLATSVLGQLDAARGYIEDALRLRLSVQDLLSAGTQLGNLAELALRAGDLEGAARHQGEALSLALQTGDLVQVAFSALVAARLCAVDARWEGVAQLLGAANQLLENLGERLLPTDQQQSEELLATLRTQLGVATDATTAEGQQLTLVEVVGLCRQAFQAVSERHRVRARRPDS